MKTFRRLADKYGIEQEEALKLITEHGKDISDPDSALEFEDEIFIEEIFRIRNRNEEKLEQQRKKEEAELSGEKSPEVKEFFDYSVPKTNPKKAYIITSVVVGFVVIFCLSFFAKLADIAKSDDVEINAISRIMQDEQSSRDAEKSNSEANSNVKAIIYNWYDGNLNRQWEYRLNISEDLYRKYATIPRDKITTDYTVFVTDSKSEEYITYIVDEFITAGTRNGYSKQQIIQMMITFVQNIDYASDLIDTTFDEYPKYPLETLYDKKGDCEDFAILLASLLMDYGCQPVLLMYDAHMSVGIPEQPGYSGTYFEYDGIKYYYIETTTTGWEIGDVPAEVENEVPEVLTIGRAQ